MAKVIQTPVIGRNARRALPVERSVPDVPAQDAARPDDAPEPAAPMVSAAEARRIVAQREAAEKRVDAAEAALKDIQGKLEELREAAQVEGREAGWKQAESAAAGQRESEAEQFQTLCSNLAEQRRERLRDTEAAAVEIAFAAMVKLLGRLNTDIGLLEAMVRQAMEQVLARHDITIYLSPADCGRMRALARRKGQDWTGVEFDADNRIQLGGCRIESRAGSLDARLELQMDELKKSLLRTAAAAGKSDD